MAREHRSGLRRASAAACVAATALLVLAPALAARGTRARHSAPRPFDGLPQIIMIDQNGRALSLASLKGRPALVAFIHTSCEGPCELITAHMKQVARDLGADFSSEVTMVSITTEPGEDGARKLRAYARTQGADGDGWLYLTGTRGKIHRLLRLYGVAAEEDRSDHVLEIFLLNADGHSVHRYNGIATAAQAIAEDIRKTAAPH